MGTLIILHANVQNICWSRALFVKIPTFLIRCSDDAYISPRTTTHTYITLPLQSVLEKVPFVRVRKTILFVKNFQLGLLAAILFFKRKLFDKEERQLSLPNIVICKAVEGLGTI
jgi:hypothetical protein